MNEIKWVDAILARFGAPGSPGNVGVGDDAAVWSLPPGEVPVLTVDAMVDGIHFRPAWLDDDELAARVIRVSASDLAAMAAHPRGVLLSIESPELPGRCGVPFWDGVERSLHELGGIPLLGGNVTRTPGPLTISCTVLGGVQPGREVLRSGARPEDELWITGTPGLAGHARVLLESGKRSPTPCPWRHPPLRHTAALALADRGLLRAAIDVSDGLGLDLARLLKASGCGAEIELAPVLAAAGKMGVDLDGPAVLEGGEDYELLFAAPPGKITEPAIAGVSLTRLGVVREESRGLGVLVDGVEVEDPGAGWDPFD